MPFSSRHAALDTLRRNKLAACVVAVVLLATPIFNWYFVTGVSNQFHDLRGGLCKIIVRSNALAQENKVALLATAARAERRAKIDQAGGRVELAQADRDAARLDEKFAGEIRPTVLNGCPRMESP